MRKYLIGIAAALTIFASCSKSPEWTSIDVNEEIEYDMSEKIDRKTFFLGTSANGFIGEAIAQRCYYIVSSAKEADVLIVKSSELAANREVLAQAYRDMKTIVEIEPVYSTHATFWNSLDAPCYLSSNEDENDLILLAVCGYSCYQLQNPFISGTFLNDGPAAEEENASASSSIDRKDNVNFISIPVAVEKTVEFFNTKLNTFAKWVDESKAYQELGDTPIPQFDGDLSKKITDASHCQHIVRTFNVGADNFEFSHVIFSSADKVSRHSTIDLSIYIAPLYSYSINGSDSAGDYYFVTMNVISHNAPLYGLYKVWHGAVRTWAHIFYSKQIEWTCTLVDQNNNPIKDARFFETPMPTSTASSTTYNTGFSKTLNVSGQGGIAGGAPTATITVGGTFTWSNSESRTVQDQSIEMSTDPTTKAVHFNFKTNNDRMEDETDDAIPAIARTDQNCQASWCWHVLNTKDDDLSTCYYLRFQLDPSYGYMWRHATWGAEGDRKTANLLKDHTYNFKMVAPNRKRNGVIEIKSTNSQYMYGLKIKDKSGNVVAKDDGAYEKNFVQRYQIAVGTYDVEYEIRDGDTGESKGNYRISDVSVKTAETTVKSTIDGKKI